MIIDHHPTMSDSGNNYQWVIPKLDSISNIISNNNGSNSSNNLSNSDGKLNLFFNEATLSSSSSSNKRGPFGSPPG